MALKHIVSGRLAGGESIVNVAPMIGAGLFRRDAERFDVADRLQTAFDLLPTGKAQLDFGAASQGSSKRP